MRQGKDVFGKWARNNHNNMFWQVPLDIYRSGGITYGTSAVAINYHSVLVDGKKEITEQRELNQGNWYLVFDANKRHRCTRGNKPLILVQTGRS